ncbi:hypothetical protein BTUL_0143g00210 [Botrytis tulipae]|uniref:Uncharacterized protein n=1 Tax=Botrytis tulipae TaxID=87230 RepID=A0A4Z1EF75_9HELO|nr:hypothetical protein BTUL_0143g00210 [Botrytis tulipae]
MHGRSFVVLNSQEHNFKESWQRRELEEKLKIPRSKIRKRSMNRISEKSEMTGWVAPIIETRASAKTPFIHRLTHAEQF